MDKALEILNRSELQCIPNEITITDKTNGSYSFFISIGFIVVLTCVLLKIMKDADERRFPETSS